MARAKYQVLVIPFTIIEGEMKYAIFHRVDMNIWQFIAGGGEDGETHLEAAKREAFEEAGIATDSPYYQLETCCSIPTECFKMAKEIWGGECLIIP